MRKEIEALNATLMEKAEDIRAVTDLGAGINLSCRDGEKLASFYDTIAHLLRELMLTRIVETKSGR